MTSERYKEIEFEGSDLTQEEYEDGWYYKNDRLIHYSWPESLNWVCGVPV